VTVARLASILVIATAVAATPPEHHDSALWGADGRAFRSGGPLPDFSWAGYHAGDARLPSPAPSSNVRDYGARGDGVADDTAAFQRALAESAPGVLLVPRGRYRLAGSLTLTRSRQVLRGEGSGAGGTTLLFSSSLTDLKGLSGLPASNEFSWSGGLVQIQPQGAERRLSAVTLSAHRGDRRLRVADARAIRTGDVFFLRLSEDQQRTLEAHLLGDPAPQESAESSCASRVLDWTFQVSSVEGDVLVLSQPLRTDVQMEWEPTVWQMPVIREVGIEHLAIEFPITPYPGHHRERGFNGVEFSRDVVDAWIRDVTIRNCDSGVFVGHRSKWLTITGLVFTSARPADQHGDRAHHGVVLSACSDVLVTDLNFEADFIHEFTITHRAVGNVLSGPVRGANLDLDHHRDAPFENLFQDLTGDVRLQAGGSRCYGPPAGVRNTYWAVDTAAAPPPWLGVGAVVVGSLVPSSKLERSPAAWIERVPDLQPRDLRAAQWRHRQAEAETRAHPSARASKRPRP
jgi:hypothetical protein